jgi:hypothetical protein
MIANTIPRTLESNLGSACAQYGNSMIDSVSGLNRMQ